MKETVNAKEPFRFYTRLNLTELTGLKASSLTELLNIMKEAPDSSIYHHTHRFLQQHQYLSPEPPNDFAYWVTDIIGDEKLGEKLASIDTIQFITISDLRDKIITVIESHIKSHPKSVQRFAMENEAFYFMKSVSFILPTQYTAVNLKEFAQIIKKVTVDSIYFHIFEARLRLGKRANDFSLWIELSVGDKELAARILKLDPYTYTLDDLRKTIVKMVEKKIS